MTYRQYCSTSTYKNTKLKIIKNFICSNDSFILFVENFVRILALRLCLHEIERKLVPKFWTFVLVARKFIRAKIYITLHFEKVIT